MSFISVKDGSIVINIRVVPNSSKTEFIKDDERLRLKITAPPVDNKANKFIIDYFSKLFKLPKSSISIIRGELSREKTLSISIDDVSKQNSVVEYFNSF